MTRPTMMRPVINKTEENYVNNLCQKHEEDSTHTLDDREEELGFAKPPDTKHIDRNDK